MIASCNFVNNPVHFTAVKFYFDTLFFFFFFFLVMYIREKVFQKWFAYCFGSVVRTMKMCRSKHTKVLDSEPF